MREAGFFICEPPAWLVVQLTKTGFAFVFDRVSGKPVFPIEERPVPQSDVPGEKTSPTQPFPVKLPPLASSVLDGSKLNRATPEVEKFCATCSRARYSRASSRLGPRR